MDIHYDYLKKAYFIKLNQTLTKIKNYGINFFLKRNGGGGAMHMTKNN